MKIEFGPPQYISCGSFLAKAIVFTMIGILLYSALTTVPFDFFKLGFALVGTVGLLFLISRWYFSTVQRFPFLPALFLAISGSANVLYQIFHQPSNYLETALFAIGIYFTALIISPFYQHIRLQGRVFIVNVFILYAFIAVFLLSSRHLINSLYAWFTNIFVLLFFIAWYMYYYNAIKGKK